MPQLGGRLSQHDAEAGDEENAGMAEDRGTDAFETRDGKSPTPLPFV